MFQFPGFPAYDYFIHRTLYGSSPYGFPHSDICGSKLICSSPQLFAACHVLLRLLMPRHSPCALLRLIYWFSRIMQAPFGFPSVEIVTHLSFHNCFKLLPSVALLVLCSLFSFQCAGPAPRGEGLSLYWDQVSALRVSKC